MIRCMQTIVLRDITVLPILIGLLAGTLGWSQSVKPFVEQTLAGVTIGQSFATAKSRFPNLKYKEGVWRTELSQDCVLEIVAGAQNESFANITVITVGYKPNPSHRDKDGCRKVISGKNLLFGASLPTVLARYPGIKIIQSDASGILLKLDNGKECEHRRTFILQTMFIEWTSIGVMSMFSVEGSRNACEQYRTSSMPK